MLPPNSCRVVRVFLWKSQGWLFGAISRTVLRRLPVRSYLDQRVSLAIVRPFSSPSLRTNVTFSGFTQVQGGTWLFYSSLDDKNHRYCSFGIASERSEHHWEERTTVTRTSHRTSASSHHLSPRRFGWPYSISRSILTI
jgi:hypothetical protein